VHVVGRDDIYPVEASKVGNLLHYVIAYELSLDGSSPYTSTDKTNKNKYT